MRQILFLQRSNLVVLALSSCLLFAARANAGPSDLDDLTRGGDGVVFDHQPYLAGGPASDSEFDVPDTPATWQFVADDFQLLQDATIRRVVWWGFYGSSLVSPAEEAPPSQSFRIRLYAPRTSDGLPGVVVFEDTVDNPTFEETGRHVGVGSLPKEYRFTADTSSPISLLASSPLWIEISQVGQIESVFRWEYSTTDPNGHAFVNDLVSDWQLSTSSSGTAFQLIAIPEPTSIAIFVLAGTLQGRRSRCITRT